MEEYEYGEVEVPGMDVTGGAVTAATTRPTTAAENRKYLAKAAAWTYLVASCTDKAYALIERCEGDPFKAWAVLQEKYCATDAEENYPELDQAFSDCKLVGTKKDPELWFNDLDHLNMRLARINLKYEKDDLQMKSHMMTSMTNDYQSVTVKFRGDLHETPLAKIRKEIVLQYKALLKDSGGAGSESVLSANMSKHPYKKFKGTCRNCGKIGHKANECRSSKVESTSGTTKGGGTTNGDKSHVTCFNCQQKGHFANKCTLPKKLKSDSTTDMGMFVGVSFSEMTEDPINKFGNYGDDNFFDNFDDSILFGDDQGHCDLSPFWGVDTATPEDTDVVLGDTSRDDESIQEHVAVLSPDAPIDESEAAIIVTTDDKTAIIGMSDYVGSATTAGHAEDWLLDSGATCGVTYDNSHMTDLKPSDRKITIGNGDKIATLGQGTVMLKDKLGQTVKLTDVYYAPSFTKHIVSMRKLIDDDWSFCVADKTEFVFTDPATKSKVKFGRNDTDMLYYFSGTRAVADDSVQHVNSLTTAPVTLDINIAHGLLGHPDTKSVTAMAAKHGWTLTGTVKPCGSCALAKARAKAIPKSTMTKAKTPGERLFLDISC